MESKSSKTSNKKDPGWNYNHMKDPKKRHHVICDFCGLISSGGISRAKKHQLGGSRDVKGCEKVSSELKEELEALYGKKQESNVRGSQNETDVNIVDDADDVKVEQVERNSGGKRESVAILGSSKAKKAKKTKDLKSLYSQKPGERTIQLNNHKEKWAKTNEVENTYDAAGSSGGPTAQSFPHNEELQHKDFMAFCRMPVIKELWKAFSEAYRGINTETSKGKTEEEQEFSEEFKLLDKCFPDMTEEGEKWLDERCERELISKFQERLKEFFEKEGITEKFTEKFKAVCLKYKEEVKGQYKETLEQIFKEDDLWNVDYLKFFPEIPTGNFMKFQEDDLLNVDYLKIFPEIPTGNFTGSSNVSSNCERELQ